MVYGGNILSVQKQSKQPKKPEGEVISETWSQSIKSKSNCYIEQLHGLLKKNDLEDFRGLMVITCMYHEII